eukprot:TRINITY_DN14849_c0_g1_i2.p1 TRINITY_DN14849_c0_g1~~TRINITY_DN14849_c0_g1_i2.p1  ORF type:complete len:265 (+),score=12.43 TRINITY_DN14849_c0_g1_i2:39-797(+)
MNAFRSVHGKLIANEAYCFIVGRDFDSYALRKTKTHSKQRMSRGKDEARIGFEIGSLMGGLMGVGMVFYFIDSASAAKARLTGQGASYGQVVWPNLVDTLKESIGEDEETRRRLESLVFTKEKFAFAALMAFSMFRTSRVYWNRRWGDIEWQRSVVYMPWYSSIGLALYVPALASTLPSLVAYAYTNRQYASDYLALLTNPRELISRSLQTTKLIVLSWLLSVFAISYAVMPLMVAGSRTSMWWAAQRASGI